MKTKLSVIIPCYNCAPVIERCLDSIDYIDAEIIVVNDGSTDNAAEVVERYIALHEEKNVLLVNKLNGGVSSARNTLTTKETTGKEALLHNEVADYVIWLGIFRRSVIVDNNLFFLNDLSLHEDDCFMGMFYCHANKVVVTDLPLYCYICASDYSSTHRQSIEKQRALINSGWKAATYRKEYVSAHYPEAIENECLKYMRWVSTPRMALEAQLTKKEYYIVLEKFRALGVYPLDYKWIKVAGYDYSFKSYVKRAIRTFLVNHLSIGWPIAKVVYQICN